MSEHCKHCGSSNWDYGTLENSWRFPKVFFQGKSGRREIAAVLCMTCGHVELVLESKVPFATAAVDHPSLRGK
jgi:hypothetical protein